MLPIPLHPRYESLDAWRGVACLSVVVSHSLNGYYATPGFADSMRANGGSVADWAVLAASQLWIGVPFFFVISGYCIAASADSTRRKPNPGLAYFYRRFRRIYPPLWAYLILAAIGIAMLPPQALPGPTAEYPHPIPYPQDVPFSQWIGTITLTEEWRPNFFGAERGYFTGQVWTLCYEEQFYIVVGLIVIVARRWLFLGIGVITALVLLNFFDLNSLLGDRIGVDLNAYQVTTPGFFFNGLWLAFAAGIGVYYRGNYATPIVRWCFDGVLIAGLIRFVLSTPSVWDFKSTTLSYLGVAFLFALVLGWMRPWDAVLARSRWTFPLRWAGQMCYSLYLVHGPITGVLQWNLYRWGLTSSAEGLLVSVPLGLALSLGLSYVFHRVVERRFLNGPIENKSPGTAVHRL